MLVMPLACFVSLQLMSYSSCKSDQYHVIVGTFYSRVVSTESQASHVKGEFFSTYSILFTVISVLYGTPG